MLTRDEIIWGYRYVLGRDPQPGEMARLLEPYPVTQMQLRERLLGSEEFAAKEKVIGHAPKWVVTEVFGGKMKIWIDLADKYVSFGCLIDNYEPEETAVFQRLLQPGFHVADVGANVGWFTFLAALCVGQEGHVTAFEPRLPTVDYLRRSVRLNQLEGQVTVLQTAVGDRSGTVSLAWVPASRNPGSTHLGEAGENEEGQAAEMQKLDTLLGGARVDCIKMDIEGAEGLALAGAGMVLQASRPFILCEINPAALGLVSQMSVDEFLRLVGAQGYVPFALEPGGGLARLQGSPEFGGREIVNVVLAHGERLPSEAFGAGG